MSASSALASTRSRHNAAELRTRLPSAAAALALVLSSSSDNKSTSGLIASASLSYSASLWNPALPIAKHANLRVVRSGSAHRSMSASNAPTARKFS
ncbi:uncharacterized protein MICPUCDRAFT_63237 [Micromonas pusilla CCMP1545]|uniref:Predicted protein n=1 Tax=Micromonas pusilla (strain CCMP1545) TaxID=564608 RepID=C1MYY3_MICPC|nr:uncharacterized protein MICPUCDRAFT_63237 [Micromonas pusilla CCMP1545]EEH54514.1 predicted protein [Micromonas pusilla CCMP1545]|eukprot:XP_003060864.1 predicted protein [Micromonas pusilla CCMP1545]